MTKLITDFNPELTDKILNLAQSAIFYENSDGVFRIEYTDMDDGYFQVIDEDSGEEYRINPEDVKSSDIFIIPIKVSASTLFGG